MAEQLLRNKRTLSPERARPASCSKDYVRCLVAGSATSYPRLSRQTANNPRVHCSSTRIAANGTIAYQAIDRRLAILEARTCESGWRLIESLTAPQTDGFCVARPAPSRRHLVRNSTSR